MARKPKGTLTVNVPGFYPRRMMVNSQTAAIAALSNATFGFYNDSTRAELLVLWHVDVQVSPPGAGTPVKILFGGRFFGKPPVATSTSGPLMPGAAKGPGSIWFQTPGSVGFDPDINAALNNSVWSWGHEWPLIVVPPGWNWILQADGGAGTANIYLLWEVLPDSL